MSTEAVAWAMRVDLTGRLSAEHRLVLITLADHASFEGNNAWPSKATVADRLGISTRSVQRAFAKLEAVGLIAKGDQRLVSHYRADRRPTVWNLRVGGRARPEIPEDDALIPDETVAAPDPGYPQRGDTSVTPHGETLVAPRGDTGGRHGETLVSPKPTTEPTTEDPPNPPRTDPPTSARSVDNPGRRPDGTCRRCDEVHRPGTRCRPVGDPVAGMAKVRAALAEAKARERG